MQVRGGGSVPGLHRQLGLTLPSPPAPLLQGWGAALGLVPHRQFSSEPETQRGADGLILPHGSDALRASTAAGAAAAQLKAACNLQLELTERQACDVELLSVG